jgi:cytochrome oxidase Cu insertion factor (SCO1/SenC/PrrC family)
MVLRILATVAIASLLVLDLFLPNTSLGRRGTEAAARVDVDTAFHATGTPLPALSLRDLDGERVTLDDFLGHRVLLTFERSVDW